jgi:catechol 2,3-dioxygenase
MSGVKKLEHATLYVTDLEEAVAFYTDVLGLVELERTDDAVYLGCGLDGNYDLGLVEGQTGLEHFAVRVDDADELDEYERRLADADVDVERPETAEPGQADAVRFALPGGVEMEFVTVEDAAYHHPTRSVGDRSRVTPRDFDHVNVMTYDVDADLEFLTEHLEFTVSDRIESETGITVQAWTRHGEYHHDVGLSTADNVSYTLNHVAFEMENLEHIKAFCDRLTEHGYQLELGPSRHNAGSNIFAYLWSPGGNRVELTAEMATVDAAAETNVRELTTETNTVSSWGGVVPTKEFLEEGS